MLADFTIKVHSTPKCNTPERSVRVLVHNDIRALRSAATQFHRHWYTKPNENHSDSIGLCHRFLDSYTSLCAVVRLAPPNIGIGIVSHELAHAAVWIRELEEDENLLLTCDNDESFCWLLGELIRQTVIKMYEHQVWE